MSNVSTQRDRNSVQGAHREILQEQTAVVDDAPLSAEELVRVRGENAVLRAQLEEMEHALSERQREFEDILEEKSEVIRTLHAQIQELQQGGASKRANLPQEEELLQLQEQLEEDRRQLRHDEEALMVQMRQMELSMSRDRAELARQRTELQRQQADLTRELELASRDSGLRERLSALQRRPDSSGRSSGPGNPVDGASPPANAQPAKSSGLLRRFFG